MDRNNDSFERQFRQKMALDSEIVSSQKKEQSKRKWVFGGVLGLAAVSTAAGYYIISRKK